MTQGEDERVVRLRYRVPLLKVTLSFVFFGVLTVLSYIEAFVLGPGELAVAFYAGVFLLILFPSLILRDVIFPRYIILGREAIDVPKEYLGRMIIRYEDLVLIKIKTRPLFRRRMPHSILLRGNEGAVNIVSVWLPSGLSAEQFKTNIANRVEIATGRRPE